MNAFKGSKKNHKVRGLFMNNVSIFDRVPVLFPSIMADTDFITIDDMFNRMFNDTKVKQMYVYPTNVYNLIDKEKNKIATVIEIAAAGFSKEDCSVTLDKNTLTVELGSTINKVKDKESEEDKSISENEYKKDYIQKNIASRYAQLSWTISNEIDSNNIDVTFKDGILSIKLPIVQKNKNESKYLTIK